ncbi:hypothetical protein COLO4_09013 [Corchorus olitorius]|uniref:Uncharacterized protein n=1 Tax=Corchorus olitorius TaxID=93759 RepID=A0A1R3KDK1_9ROSI|nr:hypothetical protein COLO4_09013 [Corchorus olitorius]
MARQHKCEKVYNKICPCRLKYKATWRLASKERQVWADSGQVFSGSDHFGFGPLPILII